MRRRSICRRCHRLRAVDETRCCPGCAVDLEKLRAPKHAPEEADTVVQAISAPRALRIVKALDAKKS